MKYEFHVGDYVETVGGTIGWVSHVDRNYITMESKEGFISGLGVFQKSNTISSVSANMILPNRKRFNIWKLRLPKAMVMSWCCGTRSTSW